MPYFDFWTRVDKTKTEGCWNWTGRKTNGYGIFRNRAAHRHSYELLVDEIPKGLVIDHLCRNRGCVNPKHLEPVSHRINILRGIGNSAKNAVKTACVKGHIFDDDNTIIRKPNGKNKKYPQRDCRECIRIFNRNAYRTKYKYTRLNQTPP